MAQSHSSPSRTVRYKRQEHGEFHLSGEVDYKKTTEYKNKHYSLTAI